MQINLLRAVGTALPLSPHVALLVVVALVASGTLLLRWFVRQPKVTRADVIRLIRALRGS